MTPEYALELRGVRKTYRGFALKDVTFTLPRGHIGGLIGPNGSGKTTIIKLIMDEPTAGLDTVFRRELLRRLSALLQDEGKSVLFSTHITSDLERVADVITFIRGGEIVFSLTRDELLDGWALVRGDEHVIRELDPRLLRGMRHRAFGVEALVSDGAAARRVVGSRAVVDRVTLDEVMVLMAGENRHAA
jgi:ABC-2 type transport system ATP-binding protein